MKNSGQFSRAESKNVVSKICCVNILIIENRWRDLMDFSMHTIWDGKVYLNTFMYFWDTGSLPKIYTMVFDQAFHGFFYSNIYVLPNI